MDVTVGEAAAATSDEEQKFMYEMFNQPNIEHAETVPATEKPDLFQVQNFNGLKTMSANSFTLVLCPGQSDYANCAGTYVKSPVTRIRGRPVYLNSVKQRIIFFNGYRWVISSYYYFAVVINGATGGFYASNDGQAYADLSSWSPRYAVN